jgi:regulator of sirC expression with transglutaminase-like and TPR domain
MAQGLGYPEVTKEDIYRQLDELAEGARKRFTPNDITQHRRFVAYNRYFFEELGFRGLEPDEFYPSRRYAL